jgi:hypothetical protein
MSLPSKNKNNAKKLVLRKRTKTPAAGKQMTMRIDAENAVGNIRASSGAEVNVIQRVFKYTPLSDDQQEARKQKSQLKRLQEAIQQKREDWKGGIKSSFKAGTNPFLSMEAFQPVDAARFFGHQDEVKEVVTGLLTRRVTFLDGTGRTSLLQAGVAPTLVKAGHLPVLVKASGEALGLSVKKQLLPSVETMDFLNGMSLAEFLRRVTDELQAEDVRAKLLVLVDQFEALPADYEQPFKREWELCISGAPDAHWLFSVPSEQKQTLNLFKDSVAINPNLVTLYPMRRDAARETLLRQAALSKIQVDEDVAEAILNTLDKPGVDPVQLQVVCYVLAGGRSTLVRHWDTQYYQSLNGADGILRSYLEREISDLDESQREPAWQLLSILIDPFEKSLSRADLVQKMKSYEAPEDVTLATLKELQDSHLVEYDTAYRLSNNSLIERIRGWQEKRAARRQAEEEFVRQLLNIGRSGLRGLVGGAIGFTLTYWVLPYVERVPLSDPTTFFQFYFFNLTLRTQLGAFAGFVMILSMDFILASLKGDRKWLRVPAAMLTGAIALGLVLFFHVMLRITGEQMVAALLRALGEGAVWGAVAGAGAIWLMRATEGIWWKLLAVSAVCGVVLAGLDLLLKGLGVSAPFTIVFLSGMLMPLFLIGSALLSKSTLWKGRKL